MFKTLPNCENSHGAQPNAATQLPSIPAPEQVNTGPTGDAELNNATVPLVRTSTGQALSFTLAPVPTYVINLGLGGFGMVSNPRETIFGGGTEVSGQAIIGLTPFPGSAGGNWRGIKIDGFLQPQGGGVLLHADISADGIDDAGGFFSLRGGLGVGYAYLHMRDIDMDYKQRGIGFSAMWRLGEQKLWSYFGIEGQDVAFSGVSHGPCLQLLFPSYAAHRGMLDYKYISLEILFWNPTNEAGVPADDGLTMVLVGSGATF